MSVPHIYTEADVNYWRDEAIRLRGSLDSSVNVQLKMQAELDSLRAENADLIRANDAMGQAIRDWECPKCAKTESRQQLVNPVLDSPTDSN